LPRTERDALHRACQNFEQVLQEKSVADNASETVETLLILSNINMQLGENDLAVKWLQACQADAVENLRVITSVLKKDERERVLSVSERAGIVSDRRKMEKTLQHCQNLRESMRNA
jgi:hypothetical protein